MTRKFAFGFSALALILAAPALTGLAPTSSAQEARMTHTAHIQPETTLSVDGTGEIALAPDMATLSGGVVTEAASAEEALSQNRTRMNGLMKALKDAGVQSRDIQTSNFSISPTYKYPENRERQLTGYTVSNSVTVRVNDLDGLGPLLDTMVAQGGNSFSGLSFGLKDASAAERRARKAAVADALEKAEDYAEAAGYSVARIVTISETGSRNPGPQMMMAARSRDSMESTPISGGEVTQRATVSVVFELSRN